MADDTIRRVRQVLNLDHKRGILGNSSGEVRNTANTGYYVRVEKSPGIYYPATVFPLRPGAIVDPAVGIPVWVGYDPFIKRDAIVGMDYTALASKGISPLHGNPNDPAAANLTSSNTLSWLYCRPHTDNTKPFYAQVYPANLVSRDEVVTFAGTEIDLSSFLPDNGYHRYVIVFLQSDFATLEAFGSTQKLTTSALDDSDLTEAFIQHTTDSIVIRAFAITGTDTKLNGRFVDSPYLRQLVSDMAIHKVQVGDSWFDANCKSGIVAAPGASDVQVGKFWQASGTWELPSDDGYFLLNGRSGGQVAHGGTGAGEDLELNSTTDPTKGSVLLAGSAVTINEATGEVIINDSHVATANLRVESDNEQYMLYLAAGSDLLRFGGSTDGTSASVADGGSMGVGAIAYSGNDARLNVSNIVVSDGYSGTLFYWYAANIQFQAAPSTNTIAGYRGYGVNCLANSASGYNIATLVAGNFQLVHSFGSTITTGTGGAFSAGGSPAGATSGTITNGYAGTFYLAKGGTGTLTITNAYNLNIRTECYTGGTFNIGTLYGIRIQSPTQTAGTLSITNNYGLYIQDQNIGAAVNAAIITNAGNVIFNEGGDANTDFRVEGDTDTHLLFTDASADKIGISEPSPSELLHMTGGNLFLDTDNSKLLLGAGKDMGIYYDGAAGNIDTDLIAASDLTIDCGTAKTVVLEVPVYDDLQFGISRGRVPAANDPTWEVFTTNTKEFAFAVDDYIDLEAAELPHWYKEDTDGEIHLHVTTQDANSSGADRFAKFTVTMAQAKIGGTWSEADYTAELTIPDGTAALTEFYLDIDTIDLSTYEIGDRLKPRVKRIAATGGTEYADEIFVNQIGVHLQKDTMGSRQEAVK